MRLGFFVVEQLDGEDAQGAAFMVKVKSQMNEAIKGTLFLPPYLRPNQCNIAADSVLFGCLDEVIGKGFAIFGQDDADFQYFFNADIEIQKTLTVKDAVSMEKTLDVTGKTTLSDALDVSKDITTSTGNITANVGDVKATTVSLKTHIHMVPTLTVAGAVSAAPPTAPVAGPGTTAAPTP